MGACASRFTEKAATLPEEPKTVEGEVVAQTEKEPVVESAPAEAENSAEEVEKAVEDFDTSKPAEESNSDVAAEEKVEDAEKTEEAVKEESTSEEKKPEAQAV